LPCRPGCGSEKSRRRQSDFLATDEASSGYPEEASSVAKKSLCLRRLFSEPQPGRQGKLKLPAAAHPHDDALENDKDVQEKTAHDRLEVRVDAIFFIFIIIFPGAKVTERLTINYLPISTLKRANLGVLGLIISFQKKHLHQQNLFIEEIF
jgi:hypothetical protein